MTLKAIVVRGTMGLVLLGFIGCATREQQLNQLTTLEQMIKQERTRLGAETDESSQPTRRKAPSAK